MNWRAAGSNRRPRFSRMREDYRTEQQVIEVLGDVRYAATIASAGCTALALAPRVQRRLWALDTAPAQTAYVEQRLRGRSPLPDGRLELMLERGRTLLEWLGVSRADLFRMVNDPEPARRLAIYERLFEQGKAGRWLRRCMGPTVIGFMVRLPLGPVLPTNAVDELFSKLKRAIGRPDAPANPYLWQLVCGCDPPDWHLPSLPPHEAKNVEVVTADFIEWSRQASAGDLDFLALSNILELASGTTWQRVLAGASRLLRPGGVALVRSVFSWPQEFPEWMPKTLRVEQGWSWQLQSEDRSVFCDEILVMRRL